MSDEVVEAFLVLIIDGLGPVFTTTGGLNAWAIAQGFTAAHPGLALPTDLAAGVELRTGLFEDTTAQFSITDVLNDLADVFGGAVADADLLIDTLEPATDPAPPGLWGLCVGGETIGPSGERRYYSCIPGYAIGMQHLGQQHAGAIGRAPTPVTSQPRVWVGRRVAVYRVKRLLSGDWQDLADAQQVWRGTMMGQGEQDSRVWAIRCAGPESWVSGNLGTAVFEQPIRVVPLFSLVEGLEKETVMTATLDFVRLDALDISETQHVWVASAQDTTSLVGATTYDDVVTAVRAFLAVIEADASSGASFKFVGSSSTLTYSTTLGYDGVTIRWDRKNEAASGFDPDVESSKCVRLRLTLHEKVWRVLGYDPRTQNSDRDPVDNEDQYGQFEEVWPRWLGSFFSADAEAMLAFETADFTQLFVPGFEGAHVCNFGAPRRWPPIYSGGAATWTMTPGQEAQIIAIDSLFLPASASRPIMADPDDPTAAITITGVGLANRQGLLVVEGPYRQRGDDDQAEPPLGYAFDISRDRKDGRTVQVARVCWREGADGSTVVDAANRPRVVIYEWLEPREYGFDWPKLTGLWSAWRDPPANGAPLTIRPLTAFNYGAAGDRLDLVMLRILATTGTTSGWYTDDTYSTAVYGLQAPAAEPEPGLNDLVAAIPVDAELADLGLGVPASLISPAAAWEEAIETIGPALQRVRVGFTAAVSARGLFGSLLAPSGLSWSLSGGKYGVMDPWRFPTPEDAVAVITPDSYGGKPGEPASARATQRLREWSPIDVLEVKARVDPITQAYAREFQRRATDPGATLRSQTIRQAVDGAHLVDHRLSIPGANWMTDLIQRWGIGFVFWARQHFVAELQLHAEVGLDLWPGDAVLVTDPWVADPSGGYGVSAAGGRVIGRIYDARREVVALRVLLNVETSWLQYAGAVVVTRYDENDEALGHRLLCVDDWLGMRGATGRFDVESLVEPYYSLEGGTTMLEGFAFDGVAWSRGIFAEVASVAAEGACWITLTGAMTGATFLRDHHHVFVLREYADQVAEWVHRWHAPICTDAGLVDGDSGKKFAG